jgi:maltooligosyltrehalose trehalohydrolase
MGANSACRRAGIARTPKDPAALTPQDRKGSQSVIKSSDEKPLGAVLSSQGACSFLVWAPRAKQVDVHIVQPRDQMIAMQSLPFGYFYVETEGVQPATEYKYLLDGEKERPDPASRFQPHGVHGASQVVSSQFVWTDHAWRGIPLAQYVIYEIHVGTFTPEGTFEAIVPRLESLKDLGITAIEIMPIAQFPGDRNWGYDGAYPFAVQNSYGGTEGFKRFVDACHKAGIAVVLDVVYNHLGPEGNYSADFAPYFTRSYKTAWGDALNFEGPDSDPVRRFFLDNALQWVEEFHVDALRLDAVHSILDISARPFIQEMAVALKEFADRSNRLIFLMPESNRNDAHMVRSRDVGGWGLGSVWNDDFHHALHVLLTGEREGYYEDYEGIEDLARSFRHGFIFTGQYSKYRKRRHGNSSANLRGEHFIVFAQNHDQIGNRHEGDRLGRIISFEESKLAAAAVLLSPFLPLIFMGEEYGEEAPFQYFVSHGDPKLIAAVQKGRIDEFDGFVDAGKVPDPQSEETFRRSKLNWELRNNGKHKILWDWYRELLRLRRELPALVQLDMETIEVEAVPGTMFLRRWSGSNQVFAVFHFDSKSRNISAAIPRGQWRKLLDSSESKWDGKGSELPDHFESAGETQFQLMPRTFALFVRESHEAAR